MISAAICGKRDSILVFWTSNIWTTPCDTSNAIRSGREWLIELKTIHGPAPYRMYWEAAIDIRIPTCR